MYIKNIESLKKELQKELKKSKELTEKLKEIEIKNLKMMSIERTTGMSPERRPSSCHGSSHHGVSNNNYKDRDRDCASSHHSGHGGRQASTMSVGEDSCILGHDEDTREANWQYLKHIVLKFILANSSERDSLSKVLVTVLHLNIKEEELLYETLEYKRSFPGMGASKPKIDI